MKTRVGTALALTALTLLTYFQFPGHTYLTQDSQIYVPILEHLHDPTVLTRDILVERPHVAFTVYDEVALGLRALTHAGFHPILAILQILFRGLGLWGIFLIAMAVLGRRGQAILVTAIFALGAEVAGPAVLTVEYEPTPRAFAIPLLFLAIGFLAHRRDLAAGIAVAVAFLFHPPSVYPILIILLLRPSLARLVPLAVAVGILLIAAYFQSGVRETQDFFARISPALEALQRLRAPYNWVSLWWRGQILHYLVLLAVAYIAVWRIRAAGELRRILVALPLIGLASIPVSYLLLERLKWSFMPQLQPTRALLFVTAFAILTAALAACRAVRWTERLAWFTLALIPSMHAGMNYAVLLGLALLCTAALFYRRLIPVAALAPFFAIPLLAHTVNYPDLHRPTLLALSEWARGSTPRDSVFLFAGPPKNLDPGVFRALALRAVYVDWKGGGQVNYLKDFAAEWWTRYQSVLLRPFSPSDISRYAALGIDYIVLTRPDHSYEIVTTHSSR